MVSCCDLPLSFAKDHIQVSVDGILTIYLLNKCESNALSLLLLSKSTMKHHSLGEFEELVLLMVAALHDEAYGVNHS